MRAAKHTTASFEIEREYHALGHRQIVGVDEVGRGAWAGAVVAGAVMLPPDVSVVEKLQGARDSKKMSPRQRARLYELIQAVAMGWGIGVASVAEINTMGIAPATKQAMRRALLDMNQRACHIWPDLLFIDHVKLENAPVDCLQVSRPKFDTLSLTVACASIIAKHWRDTQMQALEARYPGYDFAKNKGYGTEMHRAALDNLGVCEIHRATFKPIIQRRLL